MWFENVNSIHVLALYSNSTPFAFFMIVFLRNDESATCRVKAKSFFV